MRSDAPARLHALVRGHVQMVGFRYFVEAEAAKLGLSGWVRNGDDGTSVEVVAEGPRDRLQALADALRRGPRHARVDAVDIEWGEALEGLAGFRVRF